MKAAKRVSWKSIATAAEADAQLAERDRDSARELSRTYAECLTNAVKERDEQKAKASIAEGESKSLRVALRESRAQAERYAAMLDGALAVIRAQAGTEP